MPELAYWGHCLNCGKSVYGQSLCDKCSVEDEDQEEDLVTTKRLSGLTKAGRCRNGGEQ